MFFTEEVSVILVGRQSLTLYVSGLPPALFDYPEDFIKNLELINRVKFVESLFDFFNKNISNSKKCAIFLSGEIVFHKEFLTGADQEKEIKTFKEQVPIDSTKKAELILNRPNGKTIAITNEDLYTTIVEALNNAEIEVVSVSPIALVPDFAENEEFTDADIKIVSSKRGYLRSLNFLSDNLEMAGRDIMQNEKTQTGSLIPSFVNTKVVVLFIGLLFAIVFMVWVIINSNKPVNTIQPQNSLIKTEVKPEIAIPEATPTAVPGDGLKEIKSVLRIQVMNGTGKEGDAGKVKSVLIEKGYVDIEIGNKTEQNASDSAIIFKKDVDPLVQDEVQKAVAEIFSKVTVTFVENSSFDIDITTGQ